MKQKSHSGLKKRVKVTGTGKIKLCKSAKKHLLTKKSKRQKKLHKYGMIASASDSKWMNKLLVK